MKRYFTVIIITLIVVLYFGVAYGGYYADKEIHAIDRIPSAWGSLRSVTTVNLDSRSKTQALLMVFEDNYGTYRIVSISSDGAFEAPTLVIRRDK